MNTLEALQRLTLSLGLPLGRAQACTVFMDWVKAEVRPRLAALFTIEAGRDSLRLVALGKRKKLPAASLPRGRDVWAWLRKQEVSLPRGERYALPMALGGEAAGLLAVVSAQKGEALREEQRLLELALAYLAAVLRSIEEHENAERLRGERARLGASEEQYRDLVENTQDLLCIHDLEGRILSANPAGARMAGYESPEEVVGRNIRDLLAPRVRHQFEEYIAALRQNGVASGLMLVQTRSGEERVWEYHNSLRTEGVEQPIVRGLARDVTDRVRVEQALRASEERFRSLVASLPELIYVLSREGRITFLNPAFEHVTGWPVQEWLGRPFEELIHPEDRSLARERFVHALATTRTQATIELRIQTASGETRVLEVLGAANVEGGRVSGVTGYAHDITERKRAESALRASEEKYRTFIEQLPAIVYVDKLDGKGTTLFISPQVEAMLGISVQEWLQGDNSLWLGLIHPEDRPRALEAYLRLVESGQPYDIEYRVLTRDGRNLWIHDKGNVLRGSAGELLLHGMMFDITARKQAEEALQQSEEKFRLLAESSLTGIYLIQDGRFRYVNRALASIFGYEVEELVDILGPLDLTHPDDRPRVIENIRRRVEGEVEDIRYEFRGLRKDGSVFDAEVHGRRIEFGGKVGVIGTLVDITARKRRERELEANAVLARALGESLELQPLLERLLEAARHAIPAAEKGSVLLIESDGRLRIRALNGYSDPRLNDFAFASDSGYSARAARERKPLLIADARADPAIRYDGEIEEARAIHSAIVAPLLLQERVIGAIALDATRPAAFTEEDLNLLTHFAATAALIIERARLFEETHQRLLQLEALYESGLTLGSLLEPRAIGQAVVEILARRLNWHHAVVRLRKEGSDALEVIGYGAPGLRPEELTAEIERLNRAIGRVGQGMSGWVIQHGLPTRSGDLPSDPRYVETYPGIRSGLYVPIQSGGRTLGVIGVESELPNAFDEQAERFLSTLAAQAAGALENARLFETERRQREHSERLRQALEAGAALSAVLNFEGILDRLLENLERVVPFDGANIMFISPESGRIQISRLRGYAALDERKRQGLLEIDFDIASTENLRWMYEHKQALVIPDVRRYSGWVQAEDVDFTRSWVGAPILIQDRVAAFFSLDSLQPNFFNEEHALLLQAFAGQASLALQNARLYQEARRAAERRDVLHRVSREIALHARHLDEVYDSIYRAAKQLMPADNFTIALHDEAREEFVGVYLIDEGERYPPVRASVQEGISGYVIRSKAPLRIGDVLAEAAPTPVHYGSDKPSRAYLCVPLRFGERIIGAMSVQSYQPNVYTLEDETLLEMLAGHAAAAIENARLFDSVQSRFVEQQVLHAVSSACAALDDEDALLTQVTQIIGEKLYPDSGGFLLLDEEHASLRAHPSYRGVAMEDMEREVPLSTGITGQVAASGRPYRAADVRSEPNYLEVITTTRSELCVPMIAGESVLGVVNVESREVNRFTEQDEHLLMTIASQVALALERIRLYRETHRRAEETSALLEASLALSSLDLQATLQSIGERAKALFQADGCRVFLLEPDNETLRCVLALHERAETVLGIKIRLGEGVTGSVAARGQVEIVNDTLADPRSIQVPGTPVEPEAMMFVPLKEQERVIGVISVSRLGRERPFRQADMRLLEALASMASAAISNARLFEETRRRLHELETMQSLSSALRQARTVQEMLPIFVSHAAQAAGASVGSIYLLEEHSGEWVSQGWITAQGKWLPATGEMRHRPGEGVTGRVGASGETYITADWRTDSNNQPLPGEMNVLNTLHSGISLPLRAEERIIGVMHLWYAESHTFSESQRRLLSAIADMAGSALQRARLHEETQRRLQQLQALQVVDRAISSSLDLRLSLNILLEQAGAMLRADAIGILLYNPDAMVLEYAAGRGFETRLYECSRLRLGDGQAGRAALERITLAVPDLSACDPPFARPELRQGERFVAYAAVPLLAKGQLKGVLEVFFRRPLQVEGEWLRFFEMLAQQAAIAIDNAQLFEGLQRSHLELALTYEATIEGWSRALDLRDRETEGHTQRVTELTVRLAREMGLSEEEIIHLRRGALLHDIGKMGVPDAILFKPGPLNQGEWEIMCSHPQLAYDMLSPIAHLRPALDIPWCHHERWDGSGYPRGLRGEAIPLAARIFAVADVWDALISDRPYRKAWSREKALEHIRQQSGKHFDPRVVEAFLRLVEGAEE